MGTPINSGTGETRRPPAISLRDIGQYVDFAVVNEEKAPAYVYGSNEVAATKDGKPKTKDVVTVVVVQGNATIKVDDVERTVQPDDVASIHIESFMRWDPDLDKARGKGEFKSWSGAKEDLGQLEVGTVGRWYFEAEVPGKGANPRKLRLFKLRPSKPEEHARTQRCEQLYRDGTAIVLTGATAGPSPADEPF